MNDLHRVVIVGGGFGGLYAAKALGNARGIAVTLVDRRNFHLFQPLLYQVATAGLSPGDIASPLRGVLRKYKNITVLMAEATGFDLERRVVRLADGEIPYDTLIVAAGSRHSYFGNDRWEAVAPGLKTIEDALDIRRRIFLAFEAAAAYDRDDRPLPGVAPVAMQQGRYVARSIIDRLQGRETELFHYRDKGSMATIGPAAAVAQIGALRFNGYLAWLAWLFVHLLYIAEFDNRLLILIQWAWDYFTRNRGARLITGSIDVRPVSPS